jgi:hypothetical protein
MSKKLNFVIYPLSVDTSENSMKFREQLVGKTVAIGFDLEGKLAVSREAQHLNMKTRISKEEAVRDAREALEAVLVKTAEQLSELKAMPSMKSTLDKITALKVDYKIIDEDMKSNRKMCQELDDFVEERIDSVLYDVYTSARNEANKNNRGKQVLEGIKAIFARLASQKSQIAKTYKDRVVNEGKTFTTTVRGARDKLQRITEAIKEDKTFALEHGTDPAIKDEDCITAVSGGIRSTKIQTGYVSQAVQSVLDKVSVNNPTWPDLRDKLLLLLESSSTRERLQGEIQEEEEDSSAFKASATGEEHSIKAIDMAVNKAVDRALDLRSQGGQGGAAVAFNAQQQGGGGIQMQPHAQYYYPTQNQPVQYVAYNAAGQGGNGGGGGGYHGEARGRGRERGGGNKVCYEWQNHGTCRRGTTCAFDHPQRDGGGGGRGRSVTPVPLPRAGNGGGGGGICHRWDNNKSCEWGDQCRFEHVGAANSRPGTPEPGGGANKRNKK